MSRSFSSSNTNYLTFNSPSLDDVGVGVWSILRWQRFNGWLDSMELLSLGSTSNNLRLRNYYGGGYLARMVTVSSSGTNGFTTEVNHGAIIDAWIPILHTINYSTGIRKSFAYDGSGDIVVGTVGTGGTPFSIPLNNLFIGTNPDHNGTSLNGLIAEVCIWKGYEVTQADLENMFDNGVNPSLIGQANVVAYYSMREGDPNGGLDNQQGAWPTLTVSGTVPISASHPPVDLLNTAGPLFTKVDPEENKVGDDVVNLDANNWFSGTGTLEGWALLNQPSGNPAIAIDSVTGLINGVLDTTEIPTVTVSCTDDNGPGSGDFEWIVAPYQIIFAGDDRLEDADAVPIESTNFNYTAFEGTIDTLSPGQAGAEAAGITVTGGNLTITLPDSVTASKSYSVAIEILDVPDDAAGKPVVPLAILFGTGV